MSTPTADDSYLAIFDHDGVLVDTLKLHQDAWQELGEQTGMALSPEVIHQTFGMTNPSILRLVAGDTITDVEIAGLSDRKEVCYRDLARGRIALMDGVREVLDALTESGARWRSGRAASARTWNSRSMSAAWTADSPRSRRWRTSPGASPTPRSS